MGDVAPEVFKRLAVRSTTDAYGEDVGALHGGDTALCANVQVIRLCDTVTRCATTARLAAMPRVTTRVSCVTHRSPVGRRPRAHGTATATAGFPLSPELGFDERVDVTVEHGVDVARLVLGAQILDQSGTAPSRTNGSGSPTPPPTGAPTASRARCAVRRAGVRPAWHRGSAWPWPCSGAGCARSGHDTTMPVGRWVIRTAESVLLTC